MTNLLPGTFTGEWDSTGNDVGNSPAFVSLKKIEEVPTVDPDGNLEIQIPPETAITIHLGGGRSSNHFGYLAPIESGADCDGRVAFYSDVELTNIRVQAYGPHRSMYGSPETKLLSHATYDVAPAETVFDESTGLDGNPTGRAADLGNGHGGKLVLQFDAAEAGTLWLHPSWYGLTADIPDSLDMAAPGSGGDEPSEPAPPIAPDAISEALAPMVASYIGKHSSADMLERAYGQLPMIIEFVKGYTRGHGFHSGEMPELPIQACIVSAASRLAVNPQQLRQYSLGDYSATPALLTGFTLMERNTLNRYRRVWA